MATAADKNEKPDTGTKTTEKVVQYVGTADVRKILKSDWNSLGIEDQEAVEWSAKNRFTVPAKDLKSAAVEYLDTQDSGFVVKDA